MSMPLATLTLDQLRERLETAERNLRLLEAAIRHDYDSIIITELDLEAPGPKIVYVNDGFTTLTGYTREEVIGKTPRLLQGPKTDRAVLDKLKESLRNGKSFFGQTINYRKDGSEFINQWDIHPLEDENGRITHWVSYQHDISKKKKSELTFLDITADSSDLYEEAKKAIVELDANGVVMQANNLFREMIGYTKSEVVGQPIWTLLVSRQAKTLQAQYARIWEDDLTKHNSIKVLLQHRNGTMIQAEIAARKSTVDANRPVVVAEVTNLSMRKRVMSSLNRKSLDFLKMFAQKTDFSYGMIRDDSGRYRFKWVSDSFVAATGHGKDDCLKADGLENVAHPADFGKITSHLGLAFAGKTSCETYRLRCKDGSVITVMDYAKPDHHEGITGAVVLSQTVA
jgi:PAS domain S-box-containing protein